MPDESAEMRAQKRQSRVAWRLIVLSSVLCFSLGVATALLLRSMPAASWAAADQQSGSITVQTEDFSDERAVPVAVTTAAEWTANSPVDGVLRLSDCQPGEPVVSGQAPYVIDNQSIVALNLSTPPWRDFEYGIKGDDVKALQEELHRLGYLTAEPDGDFGGLTKTAVAALWTDVGGDPKQATLPLGQLIWLPAGQVTPNSCSVALGASITAGQELFTTGGGATALKVNLPEGLIAGSRSAYVGETATPLPEDGVIADQEFIQAFSKTVRYQSFLKDPSTELTVNIRLDEAVEVVAVPASALYSVVDSRACLLSGEVPQEVQIVASQFGNTLVVADPLPKQINVAPSKDAPSCR